jgi:hypothetical protein
VHDQRREQRTQDCECAEPQQHEAEDVLRKGAGVTALVANAHPDRNERRVERTLCEHPAKQVWDLQRGEMSVR